MSAEVTVYDIVGAPYYRLSGHGLRPTGPSGDWCWAEATTPCNIGSGCRVGGCVGQLSTIQLMV